MQRGLGAKYALAAILMRLRPLLGKQRPDGRSGYMPLQPTGLFIQSPDRRQLFGMTEPGLLYRGLQHIDGAIVNLQWHRIGVTILAPMGNRKSCRIAEAVGCAMHETLRMSSPMRPSVASSS